MESDKTLYGRLYKMNFTRGDIYCIAIRQTIDGSMTQDQFLEILFCEEAFQEYAKNCIMVYG